MEEFAVAETSLEPDKCTQGTEQPQQTRCGLARGLPKRRPSGLPQRSSTRIAIIASLSSADTMTSQADAQVEEPVSPQTPADTHREPGATRPNPRAAAPAKEQEAGGAESNSRECPRLAKAQKSRRASLSGNERAQRQSSRLRGNAPPLSPETAYAELDRARARKRSLQVDPGGDGVKKTCSPPVPPLQRDNCLPNDRNGKRSMTTEPPHERRKGEGSDVSAQADPGVLGKGTPPSPVPLRKSHLQNRDETPRSPKQDQDRAGQDLLNCTRAMEETGLPGSLPSNPNGVPSAPDTEGVNKKKGQDSASPTCENHRDMKPNQISGVEATGSHPGTPSQGSPSSQGAMNLPAARERTDSAAFGSPLVGFDSPAAGHPYRVDSGDTSPTMYLRFVTSPGTPREQLDMPCLTDLFPQLTNGRDDGRVDEDPLREMTQVTLDGKVFEGPDLGDGEAAGGRMPPVCTPADRLWSGSFADASETADSLGWPSATADVPTAAAGGAGTITSEADSNTELGRQSKTVKCDQSDASLLLSPIMSIDDRDEAEPPGMNGAEGMGNSEGTTPVFAALTNDHCATASPPPAQPTGAVLDKVADPRRTSSERFRGDEGSQVRAPGKNAKKVGRDEPINASFPVVDLTGMGDDESCLPKAPDVSQAVKETGKMARELQPCQINDAIKPSRKSRSGARRRLENGTVHEKAGDVGNDESTHLSTSTTGNLRSCAADNERRVSRGSAIGSAASRSRSPTTNGKDKKVKDTKMKTATKSRDNRRTKSKRRYAKSPAGLELEAFLNGLTPEPPEHPVPSSPTPPTYLGNAVGESWPIQAARGCALEAGSGGSGGRGKGAEVFNAVWDKTQFVLLPKEEERGNRLEGKDQGASDVRTSETSETGRLSAHGRSVIGVADVGQAADGDPRDSREKSTEELKTSVGGSSDAGELSLGSGPKDEAPSPSLMDVQDKILSKLSAPRQCSDKSLVLPQLYGGKGGYFEELQQPFAIEVHPNVHFVSDLHAYMMESAEVIGILAGHFDQETKVLYIQAAVPCLEQTRGAADKGHTDVEIDVVSFSAAVAGIEALGLQTVGWYHSHPKFEPNPSPIDVRNQQALQVEYARQGLPWVGLIVGRAHCPSIFRYFRNEPSPARRADTSPVECPMLLETNLASSIESSAVATARSFPQARSKRVAPALSLSADNTKPCGSPVPCACYSGQRRRWKPTRVRSYEDMPGVSCRSQGPAKDQRAVEAWRATAAVKGAAGVVSDPWLRNALLEERVFPCSSACLQAGERDASCDTEKLHEGSKARAQRAEVEARVARRREERNAVLAAVQRADERRRDTRTKLEKAAGVSDGCPSDAGSRSAKRASAVVAHKPLGTDASSPATSTEPSGDRSRGEVPVDLEQARARMRSPEGVGVSPIAALQREELFGAVASMANDPPLMFSGEMLGVLSGEPQLRPIKDADGEGGDVAEYQGGYGRELEGVVEAVVSLGRYYARTKGRATILSKTSGMPMLEKLIRSLALTLDHMTVIPSDTSDFLRDVALILAACFRETSPQLAARSSGNRRRFGSGSSGGMNDGARKFSRRAFGRGAGK